MPERDPLVNAVATPSMKATRKYFFVVIGLILAQIGMGAITAHYAVEGKAFFGFPLAEFLPYTVSRTIHTQMGIFWIATAWLATGLYIAPLLSGHEPKLQKLGVDVLFYALLAIVVGSTAFGWLGTLQRAGLRLHASGSATRASSSRAWAACGSSCSSWACSSGCSSSAARCGRR